MAFPVGWGRQCAITIDHTKVPSSQSSFPVLLGYNAVGSETNLPQEMLVTSGANAARSDGGDIRFSSDSAGSSPLHAEVVLWTQDASVDANRKAEIWVNCDPSSSVDTIIYVWYKNASATTPAANDATFGSQGVWDSNFLGVWHLPDGTTLNLNDSTSNANNGTGQNTPTAGAGKIDGGVSLVQASTQYVTVGSAMNPTAATLSAWVKATSFPDAYNAIISRISSGTNYVQLFITSAGKFAAYFRGATGDCHLDGTGSSTLSTGTLYHVVATYDSTNGVSGYVNTTSQGAGTAARGNLVTTAATTSLGYDQVTTPRGWNGVLDECHFSQIARDSNWITTEYNNQNAPSTFWTVGTPADVGGTITGNLMLMGVGT